jgi:hypothetical protein
MCNFYSAFTTVASISEIVTVTRVCRGAGIVYVYCIVYFICILYCICDCLWYPEYPKLYIRIEMLSFNVCKKY